jgi:hypothetical protein
MQPLMETENYKYAQQALTPSIAKELILEEIPGKGYQKRSSIVKTIVNLHSQRGGAPASAKDVDRVIKRAIESLETEGLANSPSYNNWIVSSTKPAAGATPPPEFAIENESDLAPKAEIEHGIGDEFVYLYSFEAYREMAKHKKEACFPCKIGRSSVDPVSRVLSQASTALPEYPTIMRLYRTDESRSLEAIIHGTLTIRGKYLETSPGTEWFLTSPEQVDEIFFWIAEKSPEEINPANLPGNDSPITDLNGRYEH